jgi:hypothetical protein
MTAITVSKPRIRTFGCNLPEPVLRDLDNIRGDINRSRYIQRLIENHLRREPQILPKVEPPRESVVSTRGADISHG